MNWHRIVKIALKNEQADIPVKKYFVKDVVSLITSLILQHLSQILLVQLLN